jgi:hypothetical protein
LGRVPQEVVEPTHPPALAVLGVLEGTALVVLAVAVLLTPQQVALAVMVALASS